MDGNPYAGDDRFALLSRTLFKQGYCVLKVAIVHYWLVSMRGGEKVVEALCELFPNADVFTHVYKPSAISETIKKHRIQTTFIQNLPGAVHHYQSYLPLMPIALEQLNLKNYDLVISSESGPAKGVVIPPDALHVCYCHTPMRYVWPLYHDYQQTASWLKRIFMPIAAHYLRLWDVTSASRVDHFFANSAYVARRVMRYYRRQSEVIHPPVDTHAFTPSDIRGDFYLMAGQLVSYKRADVAVEAFNKLGKRLTIIGGGDQSKRLRKAAAPNINFLGRQSFSVLRDHYARCRALIFPGEEDFGIVPVEAMASGRPVIAFKAGGALETVVDGVTGLFFDEQTPESLVEAIERFELMETNFSSARIAQHAEQFNRRNFKEGMRRAIETLIQDKNRQSIENLYAS